MTLQRCISRKIAVWCISEIYAKVRGYSPASRLVRKHSWKRRVRGCSRYPAQCRGEGSVS